MAFICVDYLIGSIFMRILVLFHRTYRNLPNKGVDVDVIVAVVVVLEEVVGDAIVLVSTNGRRNINITL